MAARSFPRLVEATLVPTALFYLVYTVGRWAGAFAAALVWAYGALARHLAMRRRVPGLLPLALVGLIVRTAVALVTGTTFIYFVQPVLGTCAVAAVFLLSALTARPLVARLAADAVAGGSGPGQLERGDVFAPGPDRDQRDRPTYGRRRSGRRSPSSPSRSGSPTRC